MCKPAIAPAERVSLSLLYLVYRLTSRTAGCSQTLSTYSRSHPAFGKAVLHASLAEVRRPTEVAQGNHELRFGHLTTPPPIRSCPRPHWTSNIPRFPARFAGADAPTHPSASPPPPASPPPSPPPMTRAHVGCSLVAALLSAAHAQTCRSWRQTGGCDPLGPREPAADLDCSVMVPRDASGYCECAGGRKASLVTCDHEPIVCRIECDRDTSLSGGASPSSDGCIAWRQTAGCDPQGERESDRDGACTEVVSRGASGFCECEGRRRVSFVTCDHAPFTCAVACQADRDRARSRLSAPSWRCHSRSAYGLLGLEPPALGRALSHSGAPAGPVATPG